MVFKHKGITEKNGFFSVPKKARATANKTLDKEIFRELWNSCSFTRSELELFLTNELDFCVGEAKKIHLGDNYYAINVEKNGIYITAKDEKSLVWGVITLLDMIFADNDGNAMIKCCELREKADIERRMVHFCVFPETKLWEIERFIRLCGVFKISHLIIEFWGMLKYDAMKELAWENAYTKEEIKPLLCLARDLGIEPVPMFNCWGHASQSRQCFGKHVVLSQNLGLSYLFSDDGWRWNIKNPKTAELLKKIRSELTELFGKGEYFCIGCDEADGFAYQKEETDEICNFINLISEELAIQGRKTIMWADMFLCTGEYEINKKNCYTAQAPTKESCEYIKGRLNKENIIMADWQYGETKVPVETSVELKNSGFNVLTCSWDMTAENIYACVETVKNYKLYGLIHTTWHTLSFGMPRFLQAALFCWGVLYDKPQLYATKTAEALRKAYRSGGVYEKSGWNEKQIGV